MLQCSFEVGSYIGGNDLGRGQIGALFQRIVFQPEDIQVNFVALRQFLVGEGLEAFAFLAVNAVLRVVAGDKVVEVAALERIFLEREMQIRAQVVDPLMAE